MGAIRNPEYPKGMTMRELIAQAETGPCEFCGRWAEEWTDAVHDGMCPVPFMRAAEAKLSKMEEALADCLGEYERLTGIEAQAKTYIAYLGTSRAHVEREALAEALAGESDE